MYDVIIVGAGPAGAFLAYLLASEKLNVLLLEKERLPRYKSCGGAISPKVLKLLDFDLAPVIEDTIHTIVFSHRLARPVTVTVNQPVVHLVSRKKFDALLVDKAREAGADIREGTKVELVQVTGQEAAVYANGMKWQGKILVGADGALGKVGRTLGLAVKKRMAVTLEHEILVNADKLSENRGSIKLDYGLIPGGYAWVFPKDDRLSVGVGSTSSNAKVIRPLFHDFLQAEGLIDAVSIKQVRGWPIPVCREPRDLSVGRALVIGDAAGLADAFTGEGIYAALFSARLAAEVIAEQFSRPSPDLHSYAGLVHAKMGADLEAAWGLSLWFYPLSGLIHRVLRHHRGLAEEMIRVISGDINYSQFIGSFRRQVFGK